MKCFRLGEISILRSFEKKALFKIYFLTVEISISARLGTSRLVTLDMPDALAERVMNALKADPRTVDLRALAPHFYTLSERILEIFEEEEMVDVLIDVFAIRRHPGIIASLLTVKSRPSKSGRPKFPTTRTTHEERSVKEWIFCVALMRVNGSVSGLSIFCD